MSKENKKEMKQEPTGNKSLDNPIGLITSDEVIYAGGSTSPTVTTDSYYLYYNEDWWTMTPSVYESEYGFIDYVTNSYVGGFPVTGVINVRL